MRILALGTSCVDIYPQKGTITPGGEALNIAVHLSLQGDTEAYLMGLIGKDEYASAILESVSRFDINHDHLYQVHGETAHHVIQIARDGDRFFEDGSWHGGVSADFRFGDADRSLLGGVDGVITTLWEPNLRELVDLKEKAGYLLAVDFNVQQELADWEDVLGGIDIIFSGGGESMADEMLARSHDSESIFVLTLGDQGSVAFHRGIRRDSPAVPVSPIIDTTGCGDCYQGVFLKTYLKTHDVPQSMAAASTAAAGVTQYVGGFPLSQEE